MWIQLLNNLCLVWHPNFNYHAWSHDKIISDSHFTPLRISVFLFIIFFWETYSHPADQENHIFYVPNLNVQKCEIATGMIFLSWQVPWRCWCYQLNGHFGYHTISHHSLHLHLIWCHVNVICGVIHNALSINRKTQTHTFRTTIKKVPFM